MATNNDLSLATRELFIKSVKDQIMMRTPILEELQRRTQVTYSGGKYIERLVDTEEITELGQAYDTNEALTDGKMDTLEKPRFGWKKYQFPLKYDVDEWAQNHPSGDTQLLDLADFLVKKGQRGVKLALQKMLYNINPTTGAGSETGVADGSKFFQSILSALDHDVTTYGTIARSATSNNWWMGADPSGPGFTTSTQTTATNISIANLRKWIIPVQYYLEQPQDLYIVMCPTLWNKLRAELESHQIYQADGESMKYGIQKMWIDGHQVVADPFLEVTPSGVTSTKNWVVMLNMADWELRIHTKRNFMLTDFKWQGEESNGYDYWLARIMLMGNMCCWKPNGSMFLQEVS